MRFTAAKWFATAVFAMSALGAASLSSEAEACCGLFGCCGRGCGYRSYYGPRYVGWGYGYGCGSSCYSPCWGGGCSPCGTGCSPCGSGCSPCATAGCGTCASGDCSLGAPATNSAAPNADWQKKKTYAEPAPADPKGTGSSDSGSSRINSESGLNDDGDDGIQPAGATQDGTPVLPKRKKDPAVKKADDAEGAGKAPTISIDEKVAWRSAPVRKRVEVRTHTANARLVRLPAYPKSEWLPVDSDSKVASK